MALIGRSLSVKPLKIPVLTVCNRLRTKEAQHLQVPPYVVFGDKTLIQMAKHMPKTPEEFLEIHGVASKKLEQFGEQFMQVIRDYIAENM